RGLQAGPTDATHADFPRARLFDLHAERTHCTHRRETVFAFEEAAHFGDAFGDAAEHQRAMRDRLVARDTDGAGNVRRRLGQVLGHGSKAFLSAASMRSFCSRVPMVM